MDILLAHGLAGKKKEEWLSLLSASHLRPSDDADFTVLVEDEGRPAATGSRCGNVFKYIAVAPQFQGMNLTATVFTELQKEAFAAGLSHLFLYTKPVNREMFEAMHFYKVAETGDVLLMENRDGGITGFLKSLPREERPGITGAAVMNCNPFTLGHRRLIEKAAGECGSFYVFALSEDKSIIPTADRIQLIKDGVKDIDNVTVLPTGDYLISSATFPDYFLKRETSTTAAQCRLDVEIFAGHFAPFFDIKVRYAGTEPFSPVTELYNRTMAELLPSYGIEWKEIPRFEVDGEAVSAGRVRELLGKNRPDEIRRLVPKTTFDYLESHMLI